MTDSKGLTQPASTFGDSAVDGLLAGGGAGVAMAIYLSAVGLLAGEGFGATLGRFDPPQAGSPVVGALAHLAVAGMYGAMFGVGRRLLPRRWLRPAAAWLFGLAYGLALLAVAVFILLPSTNTPLREIAPLHFALAHTLYGLVLGLLVGRNRP